ncbi:MAG: glycosidase [Deltaproteobacteria bacterium]|nr:glycosidase [Deltaproteobacteria bacterium]
MRHEPDSCYRALFKRYELNPILTCLDWPYPVNSVFNPGATMVNGRYLLLARVEDRRGFSHLCAARSADGLTDWEIDRQPTLAPWPERYPEETWGIEDPRITWIEDLGLWVVAYTAYSEAGPLVSLATTEDFVNFQRLGPVIPPEDKDAALFPVKFGGRYAMLHRPVPASSTRKHIWISFSPDLKHWGDHQVLIPARIGGWWDANKIGLSSPPLQTSEGWLILYHGVKETVGGSIYRLGLALLDSENPSRVLRRTDQWIFGPEEPYEKSGDVGNVVFPCGWMLQGNELRLYYGGADSCVAVAIGRLSDVLDFVRRCPEI